MLNLVDYVLAMAIKWVIFHETFIGKGFANLSVTPLLRLLISVPVSFSLTMEAVVSSIILVRYLSAYTATFKKTPIYIVTP